MTLARIRTKVIAVVAMSAFSTAILPVAPVSAGLVKNDEVIYQQSAEDARATVNSFMARDDVRAQFENLGVDPTEAEKRVAALSDEEVQKLADNINSSPAGQGAVGAVIGAALIIFIVLLVTDLLGFTHVFSFTNKGAANPS